MKVGSLFSGIGGIELGFEREGFETKWFVEKEPFCQAVLRKHWPGIKIYGDVKKVNFKKIEPVDILTGGFPCQDISVAGKGKGIGGERSGLWKEFFRAIGEVRPRFAVIENVSALTFRGLSNVLADLASIRYDAEWISLQARDVGAIHRRERIFIIAYPVNNEHSKKESRIISKKTEMEKRDGAQDSSSGKLNRTINSQRSNRLEENKVMARKPFFITDNWSERIQRYKQETLQREQGLSRLKSCGSVEELFERSDIPKPLVWGNDDGLSNRLDRTKAIGNAVVPQVAQFIARRIKEVIQ